MVNWPVILWILGVAWISLAATTGVPLLLALALGEPWTPFALAAVIALTPGLALALGSRRERRSLGHRDALLVTGLVWLSACGVGAVPLAVGLSLAPVDALFESVSGFTTTGSTVLAGLDELPRSVLLWRSVMQWLGGMGIVVFGVAVLPLLGVGGMQLYRAEAPGPSKDKLTPRIAETARLLWMLYVGLTLLATALFWANGMSPFDAVNHAMTAVSTGGFSTHDESFGYFRSNLLTAVGTVTMLAGGTSFAVLRRVARGGICWWDESELRAYVALFLVATALISVDLLLSSPGVFPSAVSALTHAAFQSASILTTTGYATRDFDQWPGLSHVLLLGLALVGGMAGSTSGGPKVVRVLLLAKSAARQLAQLVHPRALHVVRVGRVPVDDRMLLGALGFVAMWLLLLTVGTLVLCALGADVRSGLSAAVACLGNVGPGFGLAGPSHTLAPFDAASKVVMEVLMLLGRLEVYTLLVLLTPGFWRF